MNLIKRVERYIDVRNLLDSYEESLESGTEFGSKQSIKLLESIFNEKLTSMQSPLYTCQILISS